jgi:hypothetical protein
VADPTPVTGNSATITVGTSASLVVGTYPFTVSSGFRTVALTLIVGTGSGTTNTSDYSLNTPAATQTASAGGTASWAVNISRIATFTSAVGLAVTGLPAGATASFSPNPVTANTSTMTIATTSATPAGTFPLTLTGTSGTAVSSLALTLVVVTGTSANSGVGDPVVTVTPATQSISPGGSATYAVALSAAAGATIPAMNFAVGGLPSGVSAVLSANPTNTATQLTLATQASTPANTYTITITGTSGAIVRTVNVTLIVGGTAGGAPDFQLAITPNTRAVTVGSVTTYAIAINASGGFNSAVTFATGSSAGSITSNVTPNPATGTATLTVTVAAGTPPGPYSVTVSGTTGTITRAAAVSLTVS